VLTELGEHALDVRVDADIAFQHEVGTEFCSGLVDAILQAFVLVRKRQLRPFTMHRLGDAPGDATTAGDADDEGPLAMQEAHGLNATR